MTKEQFENVLMDYSATHGDWLDSVSETIEMRCYGGGPAGLGPRRYQAATDNAIEALKSLKIAENSVTNDEVGVDDNLIGSKLEQYLTTPAGESAR